jgi:hypothetical protein
MPRLGLRVCGLAVGLVSVGPAGARADAALDQMMQHMDDNPTPSASPTQGPGFHLAPPSYARTAWAAIASHVASINAQMRAEFSLLDHVESDVGQLWDQAVAAERDVVKNWPFPHAYWAPGIVGDATEDVLGPRGAGRVTAPLDDADPDPAPSPDDDSSTGN